MDEKYATYQVFGSFITAKKSPDQLIKFFALILFVVIIFIYQKILLIVFSLVRI